MTLPVLRPTGKCTRIDVTETGNFADFPQLGWDADGICVSMNMFKFVGHWRAACPGCGPAAFLAETSGGAVSSNQEPATSAICNRCPYVKHVRAAFARLAGEYEARGVAIVGVNSNEAAAHPERSRSACSPGEVFQ